MKLINHANTKHHRGFTLIETAVVLLILGLVLGGLLTAIGQSSQNTRRNDTQVLINRVEEALFGFAQANGRLPCPATASSLGVEAFAAAPATAAAEGICELANGFVPATTLGIQGRVDANRLLLDAWGGALRYSVATLGVAVAPPPTPKRAFTSVPGMKALFADASLLAPNPTNLIRVCNTAACDDVILANTVPAIILSRGDNFGSYTSVNEVANGGVQAAGILELRTGTGGFVSREYSEDNFDDIIVWLSPHTLFSRLVAAGKLP
jgi:prepilin-type N-terminal cleavage/methylation domain-containing protein